LATQIQIKRGSTTPAGLTVGESAMNTSTNQIYLGGTGGTVLVGGEVTGGVDMGAGSAVSANRIPTQSGVYNYVRNSTVTSFNGATGAVTGVASIGGFTGTVTVTDGTYITVRKSSNDITFTNTGVQTFNGSTGAVQGVSAAVGSTYLTVSGSTGSVTFTNTGVQTFNGLTGAVTGVTVGGANTFTALNTFNAGLSGHINISETNATGSMYLLMARGTGVTAVFADTTTTPLVYQASLGNLGLKGISLANGNDRLYITPTQITATSTVTPTASYFYFIAQGGNYFQSQTLSQIGDIGAVNSALALSIDPSTRTMTWGDGYDLTGVTSGFFGVNRSYAGMCADYAVEINSPTGKGLQLIYNDFIGAASNWVNMDVSSGGNYTLRPSGGLATVTGTLNVSAGISAAGGVTLAGTFSGTTAAFTGLVSSTVGFSGSGTNLKNIVTTFNGLSGAVTGASLGANTFTALNTFNAGISASTLTVSGGVTFSGNAYLGDNATGVTATSNDFVRILAGTNPYGLWNGVAGIYQSRKNLSASTSGVICVTPEINFASYTTVELMIEYAETIAYSGGTAWASHKFLINVTSDEEYGGVSSSSYTESITKNGDVASIPFAISTSGASIQVTATVPANSGKIYNGWRFKTTMRVY
jgi:hypothetical protein